MAANTREAILHKLRSARAPFEDVAPIPAEEKRHTVPVTDATPEEYHQRFIEEATRLHCIIHETQGDSDALEVVLDIIGEDKQALMWDSQHIPIAGLQDALNQQGIKAAAINDGTVRVGLTGVDAALAGTGSIVVVSGEGKSRQASLLPLVHVAVIKRDAVVADLETFYKHTNRATFRDHSNIAVISGPSKSADIAMELIHGMHGPGEVHLVIVP
jgi:L-lactate dehydrogenase complex protein LldG